MLLCFDLINFQIERQLVLRETLSLFLSCSGVNFLLLLPNHSFLSFAPVSFHHACSQVRPISSQNRSSHTCFTGRHLYQVRRQWSGH
jgi:hypothetical protein